MRTPHELLQASQNLMDIVKQHNVNSAQATAISRRRRKISLKKNDYQIGSSSDYSEIELVVHDDFRLGSAMTNDLSSDGLRDVAESAQALASTAPRDDKLALSQPGDVVNLPLASPDIAAIGPDDLLNLASEAFEPVFADEEITVDSGSIDLNHVSLCIVNTNDVSVSTEITYLSSMLMGMGVRDGQVTSFDYDWIGSRSLDKFPSETRRMMDELVTNLKSTFNPRKGESYKGMIILRPEVVNQMLMQVVEFHSHGNALKDNASRWADMTGKSVASPLFTVRDDPHNLEYIQATGFDSAGTPTGVCTLIDRGVLQFFMESVDSASRRGTTATGHENGLIVTRLTGGSGGIADLVKKAGRPVLSMRRFAGNLNSVTGDFSGVAKNSHMLNNGEAIPLVETMVAGNVFDLLNNIVAVGEARCHRGLIETGPYLVDGVTVSVGG